MAKRFLLAAALLTACSHHDAPPDRVADWRDDLHELATLLPAHHKNAFFHVKEADWRRAVADLDAKLPSLDDAHVEVALVKLVAMLGDSHTNLRLPRDRAFPVRVMWFDDGFFIGGARTADAWAIGKKLVAIDGHPIDDVVARLSPMIAYENEAYLHSSVPALLSDPFALAGNDLVTGDHATYTLADGAGTRDLHVDAGAGVALAPPRVLPLHLQGPTQYNYWNKYVADQRLLYFQYNVCENDDHAGPLIKLISGTLGFADQNPVDRFVIDLRSNGGGASILLEPLLFGLEQRPALAGRIFVLIGRDTFSSAVMNAIDLKRRLAATLVGTPTGGNPNGYGEIKTFELPHSHLKGKYSTKLWSDDLYRGNTVPPDILVHVTADDWFSGRDPGMDAVLAAPLPPHT